MKTKQAMAKRFTKTKRGTILKRAAGQNHFNARESGKTTKNKRRDISMAKVASRMIEKFLLH